MTLISANMELFIRGEMSRGKYPDTNKDGGLGSRIVLDGCTSCWNYLRDVGLSLLLSIESCLLFAFAGLL